MDIAEAFPGRSGKIGPFGSRDSAGKPYVTLTALGPKAEGDAYAMHDSPDGLWDLYWEQLAHFLHDATAVEWRSLPRLERAQDGSERFYISSRLSAAEHG